MKTLTRLVLCMATLHAGSALAGEVTIAERDGRQTLLVDGQPHFIKGAAGSASKAKLAEVGGNGFRTWGVGPDTRAILDEAEELGLKVSVGIWLGHNRHGFDYSDPQQVAEQFEKVRDAVEQFKAHPALLAWGLGNEMDEYGDETDAAIWSHVEASAAMIKRIDPDHPVMVTIAEIGGDRIESLHRLCPSVDIVGINSYGGGPSVAQRYTELCERLGVTPKPFVLTEYGPAGTWETGRNAFDAAPEPTSNQKAEAYRATYVGSIADHPLSLGGYAFTWGYKQEATATWFGLFLPDGTRTPAVDTLQELWTGKPPANRAPVVQPLSVSGSDSVEPGGTVRVELQASDPDGDPLKARWVLQREAERYNTGGDAEAAPPTYPDAILSADLNGAEVRMPEVPGRYRLFAYVADDHNGGSMANIPLLVKGQVPEQKGQNANLPFTVFADDMSGLPYVWSGWMGNTGAIAMNEKSDADPRSGATAMRCEYRAPDGFGGIVWQDPANDWGDLPGGRDLTGATKLTFWARGNEGGERVKFAMGLIGRDKKHFDTASAEITVTLSDDWKQYEIDLTGKDLSRIKTGFGWVVAGQGEPVVFFLDDIRYE